MWRRLLILVLVPLGIACSGTNSAAEPTTDEPLPVIAPAESGGPAVHHRQFELAVRSPDGGQTATFRVYDAVDAASRSQGLMGVTDLPPDAGMLFRFAQPRDGNFWMKNTPLPLSIAFADGDGVIVSILDMEPCRSDPCPSYGPDAPYVYALEVNRGAFQASGVAPGWRLDMPPGLPPPPG